MYDCDSVGLELQIRDADDLLASDGVVDEGRVVESDGRDPGAARRDRDRVTLVGRPAQDLLAALEVEQARRAIRQGRRHV